MSDDKLNIAAKRSGEVSAVGLRALEILEQHTRFPWPLLKAQCQRRELDPAAIGTSDVREMLDDLLDALARLTDDATATRARAQLESLLAD